MAKFCCRKLFLPPTIAAIFFFLSNNAILAQQTQAENNTAVEQLTEATKDFFALYEKQLQAVLKTRLPEEKEYVSDVVDLVRAEKLPKSIVDRSWLWVRSNRPSTQYPFVYFERILQAQGKKFELPVPKFDESIYSKPRTNSDNRRSR